MGCDIHLVLERRLAGSVDWVGVMSSDLGQPGRHKCARRNYELFANLAGVRGRPDAEKGGQYTHFIPHDVSALSLQQMAHYGSDGHSHSHMSVEDFLKIWVACTPDGDGARHKHIEYDLFGLDMSDDYEGSDGKHDWRVVFWFDN